MLNAALEVPRQGGRGTLLRESQKVPKERGVKLLKGRRNLREALDVDGRSVAVSFWNLGAQHGHVRRETRVIARCGGEVI